MYPEYLKEIKHCPFCGSPGLSKPMVMSYYNKNTGRQYFVECINCHATSCHRETEKDAIIKWNFRSVEEY